MRGFRIFGQEFRRTAERVHDHRVVERGGDDLSLVGRRAHRREVGFIRHGCIVLAGHKCLCGCGGLQVHHGHVLDREAVLLEHPGQREIGRGAGRGRGDCLALQILDRRDIVSGGHAVGAIALVELEDLLGRNAVGIPGDPGLDRRRRALDVTGCNGEMAVLLRDLFQRHVEAVLLEDACLLGEQPV